MTGITAILLAVGASVAAADPQAGWIKPGHAIASSSTGVNTPDKAIDGIVDDQSRWISEKSRHPAWMELDLASVKRIGGLHLYSGYGQEAAITDFVIQFWADGKWQDVPSARLEGNKATALAIPFDGTVEVTTNRLRIYITATPNDTARIKEIRVWSADAGDMPTVKDAAVGSPIPLIYLNQSGFNRGKPKRFTAPTLPDGTAFSVRSATGGEGLYRGVITGHIGDFSPFDPQAGDAREYVVEAGSITSVPFRIGMNWLERVSYQGMVDFMIDSRHYLGTYRAQCRGSFGWRDDHHFGWELTTLVPQYLSNPSAYDRMPRQITYQKPGDPKLWGRLEPYAESAPDLVKMIHWGADVIVTQGVAHEFLKAQLAYFLYAWPVLKTWLPEQNYAVVRDSAFAAWAEPKADRKYPYDASPEHNLLAIKTKLGSTKGELPPGFSVEPNLLMYEVSRREKRPDADLYLQAARKQAEWMVANLDWNDPQTTKGQRMSEFVTITGLAHMLNGYPGQAPAGLADKIAEWARVVIRRSDNLWDFRKLDDRDQWTPMGEKPNQWNEPGNVVGLPAALLAAQSCLTDAAMNARLDQLVFAHFDNAFGRNPTGRHFSFAAPKEIEGVEYGWYKRLQGGIGQLVNARFVIDGSPKNPAYPYHPESGAIGWTEGWIQFNTAYNISMAYLARAGTAVALERQGDELVVHLTAPLNVDYLKAETGTVQVTSPSGDSESVTVTEESTDSGMFVGRIRLTLDRPAVSGDGTLQASTGTTVECTYGYGYMGRRAGLRL